MTAARTRVGAFVAFGIAVAAALVLLVAPRASDQPDGLEKVAIEKGFGATEQPHQLEDSPLAGYQVDPVDDEGLSTGLAGLVGVVLTFAVAGGLFLLLRRRRPATAPERRGEGLR